MNEAKKYTLDRIEDDIYVLLEHPEEVNEYLIKVNEYDGTLAEGDIVVISEGTIIEVLDVETKDMKEKVSNLIEKLKNKNI